MPEETQVETAPSPTEETVVEETTEPSQEDLLQAELDRIEKKPKRSRIETLTYNRDRLDKELADERKKLGITDEEDRPLTVREFKALKTEEAFETALTLADSIENETERKLTKFHLENTIKPSGNPETDLKNARLIVNSVKNGQIVEETLRTTKPKAAGTAGGAPPKETQPTDLTTEEKTMMSAFKLTEAQVLAARPKE